MKKIDKTTLAKLLDCIWKEREVSWNASDTLYAKTFGDCVTNQLKEFGFDEGWYWPVYLLVTQDYAELQEWIETYR